MVANPIDDHTFDSAAPCPPELIARHDVLGPRYTSYPTAVEFHGEFTAADYRAAVAESNGAPIPAPLSLYLHIPFCHSLCYYCACNKLVTQDRDKAAHYLDLLLAETAMHAELLDSDREVHQLHLGGGTPTYFDDAQIARLVRSIGRDFNCSPAINGEWSIEIDPRTVDAGRIAYLAELGFNRVSFGVQDLDPAVQRAVNREQSAAEIQGCIEAARRAGMASVSIDLIYGLPLQSAPSFARTLDEIVAMRPDRLAIYNYAHLPDRFRSQRLIAGHQLPAAGEKLTMLAAIREQLLAAGYRHIGMDHYATPDDPLSAALDHGSLQRNFQGYSTHAECEMIGIGVSAIGQIGNAYAQNEHHLPAYETRVAAGEIPIKRGLKLSPDDQLRAAVIQQIMCSMRIDRQRLGAAFDIDFGDYFRDEERALKPFIADGLLVRETAGYRVTELGRYFLRNIAMCFDAYLNTTRGGFSKTL